MTPNSDPVCRRRKGTDNGASAAPDNSNPPETSTLIPFPPSISQPESTVSLVPCQAAKAPDPREKQRIQCSPGQPGPIGDR
ncbi:hypothetical protein N7461_001827 [Penicillium sp. DV-2018c]|nr:hypothetical protein N7461_001827 [Penicillium sp. DV-2018c]